MHPSRLPGLTKNGFEPTSLNKTSRRDDHFATANDALFMRSQSASWKAQVFGGAQVTETEDEEMTFFCGVVKEDVLVRSPVCF